MTNLMLPLELWGKMVWFMENTFLRSHVQDITKEWHFLWQWWKMNKTLICRENRIEMTRGDFFPLNMCLPFHLSTHSISHITYGHLDGFVLYSFFKRHTRTHDCDCGARADLHLWISIHSLTFTCQLANAVGLKAMINNGWPNHSLAKIHK